jgi:hypothetical protein
VLRSARLLRVFKLARCWPELNRIIGTILHSFSQVVHLSLLLLLFVFVFALMVSERRSWRGLHAAGLTGVGRRLRSCARCA